MVMIVSACGRHNGMVMSTVARHHNDSVLPERYRKNKKQKVRTKKNGGAWDRTGPKPEKVNSDIVKLIRRDYASGEFTIKQLATRYCISLPYAGAIIKRKKWQHV